MKIASVFSEKIARQTQADFDQVLRDDEQAIPSQNRVAQPPPAVFEFRLSNRHQSTGNCARATPPKKEI